ncbi:MAG TPA: hypothetical protein VGL67_10230 [Casimicrobiaceae bacterium]
MMTYEEFRAEMESYRRDADAEASARKDSQLVLDRLHSLYRRLNASEQAMANRVLAEWTLSADEGMRFDALALIDEFKIEEARSALDILAHRLGKSKAPGAPYELEKVKRIAANISGTY